MRGLTRKQQLFADYFILYEGDRARAAREAGYSNNTAKYNTYYLIQHPNIKNYIDSQLSKIDSTRLASRDEIIEFLTKQVRGEIKDTVSGVCTVGKYKQEIVTKEVPLSQKLRQNAAHILAKIYNAADKKELTTTPDTAIIEVEFVNPTEVIDITDNEIKEINEVKAIKEDSNLIEDITEDDSDSLLAPL